MDLGLGMALAAIYMTGATIVALILMRKNYNFSGPPPFVASWSFVLVVFWPFVAAIMLICLILMIIFMAIYFALLIIAMPYFVIKAWGSARTIYAEYLKKQDTEKQD